MAGVVRTAREGDVGLLIIDSPPVNASSQPVRDGLLSGLRLMASDASLSAVVIACEGKTWMVGADIGEFVLEAIPAPDPNEVHAYIESFGLPVIAALHGTALGGGLELALACDYRMAAAGTQLGLPEVKLGVIPGAGGTQRLPRLVGVRQALDMMLSGQPVSAKAALSMGLVDAIAEGDVLQAAVHFAASVVAEKRGKRPLRERRMSDADLGEDFFGSFGRKLPPAQRGGRASHAVLSCVETGMEANFDEALRHERQHFDACRASEESLALRHIFFAEREAAKLPGASAHADLRAVHRVGILGAGTMGVGIALCFTAAGFPVTLVDVSPAGLQRGMERARSVLLGAVDKSRINDEDMQRQLLLLSPSIHDEALAGCDLVIEAVFETMEIKRAVCKRLGELCRPGAILASNTSSLDLDVLAQSSGRPTDFIGMHFFSPAHVMRLLEVVRGAKTDPQVLATVMALARQIKKVPVVSGVCFGFIGNRMLEGYLRETEFLLLEGATPAQIDAAIEAQGMAMGPCRMIDMAGVDVAAKVVLEQKKSNPKLKDPAYRVVVQALNERGWHGQKSGVGYYRYQGRQLLPNEELMPLLVELAKVHGFARRALIADDEIVERCLLPLINEGAKILEDGIAYRPGDIDVVWVHGYGFPAYAGGPMHYAKRQGVQRIVERLKYFGKSRGDAYGYWQPSRSFLEL